MLHILWVILRTILIILAILAGLVLLILLTILFCPIRYRGRGRKDDSTLEGQARVSWLFGAISGNVSYANGKQDFDIRIFGITLEKYKHFFSKCKGMFARKDTRKKTKPETAERPAEEISQARDVEPEARTDVITSNDQGTFDEDAVKEENEPGLWQKIADGFRKVINPIVKLFKFVISIPKRICQFFRKIALTIRKICGNIEQWKLFLGDERVRGAVRAAKDQLIVLLKHLAPRKIEGNVTFGFEDPSVTGQVLAIVGVTCPIHKNVVDIQPVFDHQVLEADVKLRGRIYLFVIARIAMELYFDKNIKYMMKAMKRKEG